MGICCKITSVKFIFVLSGVFIFLAFFIAVTALANDTFNYPPNAGDDPAVSQPSTGIGNAFEVGAGTPLNAVAVQGAGYNTTATFTGIISTVLTAVLGLLGVVFLILAIYAGFNWMMARGNEEMVEKAKQTLINAIIGIVIVLAAYVIVRFVVEVIGGMVFRAQP